MLKKFPILTILIVFVLWLTVKLKISDRRERRTKEAFLERERAANETRRQPLDSLDYIKVPLEQFPFCETSDEKTKELQETIKSLSEKKIVNLNGQSNTDLKLAYGAANLPLLTEYDQNYSDLIRTLYLWGQQLYEDGRTKDACTVLEYSISLKSDISGAYLLLAAIYQAQGAISKLDALRETAMQLDSLMKSTILKNLDTISGESAHADE